MSCTRKNKKKTRESTPVVFCAIYNLLNEPGYYRHRKKKNRQYNKLC
jgi:hypothetical protein